MPIALHTRHDKDLLYMSRKEGRRGLANIEYSFDTLIRRKEEYKKKEQISASSNNKRINTTTITRKKLAEKQPYFKRQISEISIKKIWTPLRKDKT